MKVLLKAGEGYYEEKKSRFIAVLCPVSTKEEAVSFIERQKKQYWDAKHNCSAFVLGENAEITRSSDDGEPAQTAGKPILEVLLHSEVRNVACVVTRYFGGTLLGTGGLIRAYSQAVKNALAESEIGEERKGYLNRILVDYNQEGKLKHYFKEEGIVVTDTEYGQNVRITFRVLLEQQEKTISKLTDLTSGQITLEEKKECTFMDVRQIAESEIIQEESEYEQGR